MSRVLTLSELAWVLPWVALQLALPPVLSAARSALPLVA